MKIAHRKRGWIGVDVGTSTVKIAQVIRSRNGWRLAASAVVPRQQNWPAGLNMMSPAISSLDEMCAARSLQEGYAGRQVAATLPMALCDVHRIDRSLSGEPNAQQILRQTIETAMQRSADDLQYDSWFAPATDKTPGWTQALATPRTWTDLLCADIAQAGWSCEAIDGLPMTLARAVNMVQAKTQPDASNAPIAALDWGDGRATLCLIEHGQPAYVRCLKDCGLGRLIDALIENLQVTKIEAQQMLEEFGLSATSPTGNSEIATLLQEVIAEPMRRLVEEIKRSLAHYQYLNRVDPPQSLYVLGGGGLINEADAYLSAQLQIETKIWQLPTDNSKKYSHRSLADCQLASAIALSALAWEAQ